MTDSICVNRSRRLAPPLGGYLGSTIPGLIHDIPEAVLVGVDAHAARLGLSRVEYIRRRLAADAATSNAQVSSQDLRAFASSFAELADEGVMDAAWR